MDNKYLEIDSTYRDRSQDPLPSNFTVYLSQTGTKDKKSSTDRVSSAAPELIWRPNDLQISGTVKADESNNLSRFLVQYPVVTSPPRPANRTYNYYVRQPVVVGTSQASLILEWTFMSTDGVNDLFSMAVDPLLTTTIALIRAGGLSISHGDPTDAKASPPVFFIPGSTTKENYYSSFILYNQRRNEWRPIISYNAVTSLAGLDLSAAYGGPVLTWTNQHTYVVRSVPPYITSNPNAFTANGTTTTVMLPVVSNPDLYVNNFIRFTDNQPPITPHPNRNIICLITSYEVVGSNGVGTLDKTLPAAPIIGDTYEILPFSKDNMYPLVYTGSTLSHQGAVCYEVELLNIVLPNLVLKSGGHIAYYPFVYVELQNMSSASSGLVNILYSNNPNSTRKLFRCPIDDITHPSSSPFIKIDSDGTRQTIKFKPNDNLRFGVYIPNGKLFETIIQDSYSPLSPNPYVQISAIFVLRRL